jgi:hypothetical protein
MSQDVLLHAEDRYRMIRLYEEVLTRLEEMAMITGRTLGLGPLTVYDIRFGRLTAPGSGDSNAVELVRGVMTSGCYDYNRGVCFHHEPLGPAEEQRSLQHTVSTTAYQIPTEAILLLDD